LETSGEDHASELFDKTVGPEMVLQYDSRRAAGVLVVLCFCNVRNGKAINDDVVDRSNQDIMKQIDTEVKEKKMDTEVSDADDILKHFIMQLCTC